MPPRGRDGSRLGRATSRTDDCRRLAYVAFHLREIDESAPTISGFVEAHDTAAPSLRANPRRSLATHRRLAQVIRPSARSSAAGRTRVTIPPAPSHTITRARARVITGSGFGSAVNFPTRNRHQFRRPTGSRAWSSHPATGVRPEKLCYFRSRTSRRSFLNSDRAFRNSSLSSLFSNSRPLTRRCSLYLCTSSSWRRRYSSIEMPCCRA